MAVGCPPNCIKGTPLWSLYDVTDSNPEFCLFESVVGEYTDIAGFPVLYYKARSKMDRLYGEDPNQIFETPIQTKLYYEPSEEPNIIDGMGIRSDETLQYSLLPKSTFTRDVGQGVENISGIPNILSNIISGSGYAQGTRVPVTGGSGQGLTLDIKVNATGQVIHTKIEDPGYGYVKNEVVTINAANTTPATVTIENVTKRPNQPMPGDVIKTLWNDRNYEVVDIGSEQSIFMGRKLIWEFILRPFRFSEQSASATSIHRSSTQLLNIYIDPTGTMVDLMYEDGTEANGLDISVLATLTPPIVINPETLECDSVYTVNMDGSIETSTQTVTDEPFDTLEGTYQATGLPFNDYSSKKYGDDSWIEIESDKIDDYSDLDDSIFNPVATTPIAYGSNINTSITQPIVDGFDTLLIAESGVNDLIYTSISGYTHVVVPVSLGIPVFAVNSLPVTFVQTAGTYDINGITYSCNIFRSQYILNGDVVVVMEIN